MATSSCLSHSLVRLAHRGRDRLVVVHQLAHHLAGGDELLVVVLDRLQLGDVADRAQRGAADLADALGDLVGGGEDRGGLLVEQQVVVAEMRPADVPVEILGLEIEREGIGQDAVQRLGNLGDRLVVEVGRGVEFGRGVAALELGDFAHGFASCSFGFDGRLDGVLQTQCAGPGSGFH